jgi:hypothetical protein
MFVGLRSPESPASSRSARWRSTFATEHGSSGTLAEQGHGEFASVRRAPGATQRIFILSLEQPGLCRGLLRFDEDVDMRSLSRCPRQVVQPVDESKGSTAHVERIEQGSSIGFSCEAIRATA